MTAVPDNAAEFADMPISKPEEDLFGLVPFSGALARSLVGIKSPRGVVVGINGPWGSGKSSAINLVRHELRAQEAAGEIEILTFDPWWFSGEDALALEFFRMLNASIKSSLSAKAKKALPKIGARILRTGATVASPVAAAAGLGIAGDIAKSVLDGAAKLIENDETVASIYAELVEALQKQKKRFIVFVDDIDRLNPDEALAIFRLIKSVGRLPNVIYVLAFDRALAERVVSDKFPSEGPHYLEKIIQASFDIPPLNEAALTNILLSAIHTTIGIPQVQSDQVRFMNIFYATVRPLVRTPRDAVRFGNDIAITWAAVANEADAASFVAIEGYRLFRPGIYHAIREHQKLVCGGANLSGNRQRGSAEDLDQQLLASVDDPASYRDGLSRLFPKLTSIWSNFYQSADAVWAAGRYVCDEDSFPLYFTYSLPAGMLPRKEIDEVIANAHDAIWISARFVAAVGETTGQGTTLAGPLLDALKVRGPTIPLSVASSLLGGIFKVADQLLGVDEAQGFLEVANNELRIHWLLRRILFDRTDIPQRSKILRDAAKGASLVWLADFARSALADYDRETETAKNPDQTLMTLADAQAVASQALRAIKRAARDGSLIASGELRSLLFRWSGFTGDDGVSVKKWTSARLSDDAAVVKLAAAFTTSSKSHSGDDLVSTRNDHAAVDSLDLIMDVDRFRKRLESLRRRLSPDSGDFQKVDRFLTAWDKGERY